jgi:hypothetical protein
MRTWPRSVAAQWRWRSDDSEKRWENYWAKLLKRYSDLNDETIADHYLAPLRTARTT